MTLLKSNPVPHNRKNHPLIQSFLKCENGQDFPFSMALDALEKLEYSCADEKELNLCLLEDIITSSIYATFYEAIFAAIKDNPQLAPALVEQFEKSAREREQIIAQQSEHHINFILNDGHCLGCISCENHSDVNELILHWKNANKKFFLTLYMGMQTIQYAMQHVLYDVIPLNKAIISHLGQQDICHFRQFLYGYVENRI